MKYIILICSLFILISGIVIYALYSSQEHLDQEAIAIKINDRMISKDEFKTRFVYRSNHLHDIDDFVQSLISKELFIQEAQTLKIDQEEEFRHAIQNFYEQSLIRLLMDRKMESLDIKVNDALVDRYAYLLDKTVEFSIWDLDSLDGLEKEIKVSNLGDGKTLQSPFQDLSMELKYIITGLQEGELSQPKLVNTDMLNSQYIIVQLKRVISPKNKVSATIDKEKIKEQLLCSKQQRELNMWVENLKKSADIQLLVDLEDPQLIQELNQKAQTR